MILLAYTVDLSFVNAPLVVARVSVVDKVTGLNKNIELRFTDDDARNICEMVPNPQSNHAPDASPSMMATGNISRTKLDAACEKSLTEVLNPVTLVESMAKAKEMVDISKAAASAAKAAEEARAGAEKDLNAKMTLIKAADVVHKSVERDALEASAMLQDARAAIQIANQDLERIAEQQKAEKARLEEMSAKIAVMEAASATRSVKKAEPLTDRVYTLEEKVTKGPTSNVWGTVKMVQRDQGGHLYTVQWSQGHVGAGTYRGKELSPWPRPVEEALPIIEEVVIPDAVETKNSLAETGEHEEAPKLFPLGLSGGKLDAGATLVCEGTPVRIGNDERFLMKRLIVPSELNGDRGLVLDEVLVGNVIVAENKLASDFSEKSELEFVPGVPIDNGTTLRVKVRNPSSSAVDFFTMVAIGEVVKVEAPVRPMPSVETFMEGIGKASKVAFDMIDGGGERLPPGPFTLRYLILDIPAGVTRTYGASMSKLAEDQRFVPERMVLPDLGVLHEGLVISLKVGGVPIFEGRSGKDFIGEEGGFLEGSEGPIGPIDKNQLIEFRMFNPSGEDIVDPFGPRVLGRVL